MIRTHHTSSLSVLFVALLAAAGLAWSGCSGGSTDASNDTGLTVTTDGGGNCGEGMAFCGGECVDVTTNSSHCGQCGNSCQSGNTCVGGSCSQQPEDCREEPCRGLTYCDLNTGNCKPGCSSDDQCSNNEQCETAAHECVCVSGTRRFKGSCIEEQECEERFCSDGEYCDLQAGECRSGCDADSQCGSAEKCDTSSNECVCQSGKTRFKGECVTQQECNEQFCSDDEYCNLQFGECRSGCNADRHCGDTEVCETSSNSCVCNSGTERFEGECLDEATCNEQYCGKYEYCNFSTSTCATGCHSDSQCGAGGTCNTSSHECECGEGYVKVGYGCLDKTTTIEQGQGVGRFESIAVADSGDIHISYDDDQGNLRYAHWNGRTWNKKTFSSADTRGDHSAIAVDSGGVPHIAYRDDSNQNLMYAEKSGGTWSIETASSDPDVGTYNSIVVDRTGDPHIAHYDSGGEAFVYTDKSSSGWETEKIGDSALGGPTDLEMTSSGDLRLAYSHSQPRSDTQLRGVSFARPSSGSTWSNELIDSDTVQEAVALVSNASNDAYVAYRARGGAYSAEQDSSGWDTDRIDRSEADVITTGIDASGNRHVFFHADYSLMHYYQSGGFWTGDEIDGPADAGIGPDVDIHDGRAYVVHRVENDDHLLLSIIDL